MKRSERQLNIHNTLISTVLIGEDDFISLTDMAKAQGRDTAVVAHWMTTGRTIEFLGLWEQLYNPEFKSPGFRGFRNMASTSGFYLSPQKWIEETGAIGIQSRRGRYGGVFAHKDIAFEFGSYLSAEFKLLLIKEYQVMKQREVEGAEWDAQRFLTKEHYKLQTQAVKEMLVTKVPKDKGWLEYTSEADMLNVLVFGMRAQDWRDAHPDEAKKGQNIRDAAPKLQLTILSGLESVNTRLILKGIPRADRYRELEEFVRWQTKNVLAKRAEVEQLDRLDTQQLPPGSGQAQDNQNAA